MGKAKWNISTDQELIYVHISIEKNSETAARPMSVTPESSRDFADSTQWSRPGKQRRFHSAIIEIIVYNSKIVNSWLGTFLHGHKGTFLPKIARDGKSNKNSRVTFLGKKN